MFSPVSQFVLQCIPICESSLITLIYLKWSRSFLFFSWICEKITSLSFYQLGLWPSFWHLNNHISVSFVDWDWVYYVVAWILAFYLSCFILQSKLSIWSFRVMDLITLHLHVSEIYELGVNFWLMLYLRKGPYAMYCIFFMYGSRFFFKAQANTICFWRGQKYE